jgi:hypothetical protein
MDAGHDRLTLARATFCGVELCPCGTLHLTVGPVTVRFPQSILREIVDTMIRAENALHVREGKLELVDCKEGLPS